MIEEVEISRLIDHRNRKWFDSVSASYTVTFEKSPNEEHSIYTIGDNIVIYLPEGTHCIDSFSHELLHGYMEAQGCHLGGNLKNTLWQSNILKEIFDTALVEHVSNSMSHLLMLPLFLKHEFNREKFLLDYRTYKCEPGLLNELQKFYKQKGQYNLGAVKMLIGKFFAFKCDPNPDFDYAKPLAQLQQMDTQLYHVLNRYFDSWSSYDFEHDYFGAYRNINLVLYKDMKPWLTGKKIT